MAADILESDLMTAQNGGSGVHHAQTILTERDDVLGRVRGAGNTERLIGVAGYGSRVD